MEVKTGELRTDNFKRLTFEEIEINLEWGAIRGKKFGNGARKVLAVHGWLDNANSFDLVLPYICNNATIVSVDLPGHGLSDHYPPGCIYDCKSYIGSLKKLTTKLEWNNFTYLSHSLGAVIGIAYCAVFPEDVNTFISIDIIRPWSVKPENFALTLRSYYDSLFKNEDHASKVPLKYEENELISRLINGTNSLDETSAKVLMERSSKLCCDGKFTLTRDLRAKTHFIGFIPSEVWIEFGKAIKCPVLLIKAKHGKNFGSPEITEAMKEAFKEGCPLYRYFEVDGKHHIHLTNSEAVGSILKEFFQLSEDFIK